MADGSGYLLPRDPDNVLIEDVSGNTVSCPAFSGLLWLHSNQTGVKTARMELTGGFALFPSPTGKADPVGPRLPLLGGLALYHNDFKLVIDYKNLDFSLGEQV